MSESYIGTYLKDENGVIITPIVSTKTIYYNEKYNLDNDIFLTQKRFIYKGHATPTDNTIPTFTTDETSGSNFISISGNKIILKKAGTYDVRVYGRIADASAGSSDGNDTGLYINHYNSSGTQLIKTENWISQFHRLTAFHNLEIQNPENGYIQVYWRKAAVTSYTATIYVEIFYEGELS